jgi:hypothetical protein
MFGKKRKSKAEQVAQDAWDNLVSAMESAGDSARSTARSVGSSAGDTARTVGRRTSGLASDFAGQVEDKATDFAGEAWARAANAFDALAGRKPRRPWGWIVLGVLGGVAVGYAAASQAPKAVSAAMDKFSEDDDEFVVGTH